MTLPKVSVVIATRERPELLRLACESIWKQDYQGPIELIVVFDQATPEYVPIENGSFVWPRSKRTLVNVRSPGLAGARNTGILASTAEFVAFCDDDDTWSTSKLRLQMDELRRSDAVACVAGIHIQYGGSSRQRIPAVDVIDVHHISRSRLTGAHPSTYLIRRSVLLGDVGLVDEDLPYGYGEDYDLLLRLARNGTVVVVRAPLVEVLWHEKSFFARRWQAMESGVAYLLEKHPEISRSRRGRSWMEGQRSFALAALGNRRRALESAWRALRLNPREPRAALAVLVALRLVSAETILHHLNQRGRGI